jgi:hypothetical protein
MEYVFSHDLEHVVAVGMGGPSDNWATDDFSGIFERGNRDGATFEPHLLSQSEAGRVLPSIEHFLSRIW